MSLSQVGLSLTKSFQAEKQEVAAGIRHEKVVVTPGVDVAARQVQKFPPPGFKIFDLDLTAGYGAKAAALQSAGGASAELTQGIEGEMAALFLDLTAGYGAKADVLKVGGGASAELAELTKNPLYNKPIPVKDKQNGIMVEGIVTLSEDGTVSGAYNAKNDNTFVGHRSFHTLVGKDSEGKVIWEESVGYKGIDAKIAFWKKPEAKGEFNKFTLEKDFADKTASIELQLKDKEPMSKSYRTFKDPVFPTMDQVKGLNPEAEEVMICMKKGSGEVHVHLFDNKGGQFGVWNGEGGFKGKIAHEYNQHIDDYVVIGRIKNDEKFQSAINGLIEGKYKKENKYKIVNDVVANVKYYFTGDLITRGENCHTFTRELAESCNAVIDKQGCELWEAIVNSNSSVQVGIGGNF